MNVSKKVHNSYDDVCLLNIFYVAEKKDLKVKKIPIILLKPRIWFTFPFISRDSAFQMIS